MSSRERLLAAIDGAEGAPVACSFMLFRALRDRCGDEYEFALRQAELGLDARIRLDDLPVRFAPEVRVREWVEPQPADGTPLLTRVYETPSGSLEAAVRQSEGWPYGDRLPLFSDYIVPRAVKHLVTEPGDLEALRHLLMAPEGKDVEEFREEAAARKRFAAEHGLLLAGGWRGERRLQSEDRGLIGENFSTVSVVDTLMWLCGGTAPLLWAYDEPDFLGALIELLAEWNHRRLAVHLEAGPDIVFRRAWYEGTEFWSPQLYRRFILPSLEREVALAHEAGARYGYIISSGIAGVAGCLLEAGVDAVVGIDPAQGKGTTLGEVRESLGVKAALWGGVSGALTVERGTDAEVRSAVEEAISALGPTGRFILSPVDNVRAADDHTWRNVEVFIETWRSVTH